MTHSPPTSRAFVHPTFRLFIADRLFATLQYFALSVAVGQYVFEVTRDPYKLGYVGLALFLPKITFTLFAGELADRLPKRGIILVGRVASALLCGTLAFAAARHEIPLALLYPLLFAIGTAETFARPADQALLPELVPEDAFGNAVAWSAAAFQIAMITGPLLAGWVYAATGGPEMVFSVCSAANLACAIVIFRLPQVAPKAKKPSVSWKTLMAGVGYIFSHRLLLGIISLDLFAVLFGGAVGLLPIFANDILKVGPQGLGWLRAAPSFGAVATAFAMTRLPPLKRAGPTLFACVALFGAATIVFGLSKNYPLSLAMLVIAGAADMISVIIRGVLVQTKTPPEMRGRVSAVNMVFIGASNELGEFESGVTAGLFGTVPAVVIGGIGTLAVVGVWMRRFPEVRKIGRLEK
jgi:MFS family permease